MTNLFSSLSEEQEKLMEERNKLIDEQERLRVHHYRDESTVLTDDDKKFDSLQAQIDEINARIYQ